MVCSYLWVYQYVHVYQFYLFLPIAFCFYKLSLSLSLYIYIYIYIYSVCVCSCVYPLSSYFSIYSQSVHIFLLILSLLFIIYVLFFFLLYFFEPFFIFTFFSYFLVYFFIYIWNCIEVGTLINGMHLSSETQDRREVLGKIEWKTYNFKCNKSFSLHTNRTDKKRTETNITLHQCCHRCQNQFNDNVGLTYVKLFQNRCSPWLVSHLKNLFCPTILLIDICQCYF